MRHRSLFIALPSLAVLLLAVGACDSSNPIAPEGTIITLSANPTTISVNGSSVITVTGFRPDGNPLNPGTQIQLATSLGVVAPTVVSIADNGTAVATLTADGRTGTASISARPTSGTGEAATVDVQIGASAETKPILTGTAEPAILGFGESAVVTVRATNPDGTPFGPGGRIQLRADLGSVTPEIVTGANSLATGTFVAGSEPGMANVIAVMDSSDELMIPITIDPMAPTLDVFANPSDIAILEPATITIIARDNNQIPLGAGERITLVATLGAIESETVTDAGGRATATFIAGDQAGTGRVDAFLRNAQGSVDINIRDAVASLFFTATPNAVDRVETGTNVMLTARAVNAQGDAVAGQTVIFESPVGSFSQATGGVVTTNTFGIAEETLTVTSQDLRGIMENGTFIVTATVNSEGNTFTREQTITVRGAPGN